MFNQLFLQVLAQTIRHVHIRLGGATPAFLKAVGDFFKEQGNIPEARETYDGAVNTGPLQAASQM